MTQKQASNNNNSHNANNGTTTYPARLHAAYLKLGFKYDDANQSLQDMRRERLFQRLVLHHLAAHGVPSLARWHMSADARATCLYDFIQTYAKTLWPGSVAQRAHLAHPALRPKSERSFVGAFDGQWTQKACGSKKRPACTPEAEKAASKIGKALERYVEVVLEMGLQGAGAEDVEGLLDGILQTKEIVDDGQELDLVVGVGDAGFGVKMEVEDGRVLSLVAGIGTAGSTIKMEVDDDQVMVKVEDEDG